MTRHVAIIGAGIGAEHAAGYAQLPDRFHVATICDLDEARGRALAETLPGAQWVASLDAVLADPAIDVVDVCLPPHLHVMAATRALEAGKHVICEKPLATSLEAADKLAALAAEKGLMLSPVFQYRYGRGGAQMRALSRAGLTGRPFVATLETHWNRDRAYYAVPWRGTWAGESGGAILGHAIHIHDLLTAFLGPVASVHAELASRVNEIEVEDCAALAIRMVSGAVVTSSVTLGGATDHSRLRFVFEGMTVESDHSPYAPAAADWSFTARAPYEQAAIDAALADLAPQKPGFAGYFEAVADALDGHGGDEVTIEDGRRSLEFVTAVYASARGGHPVALPLDARHPLYSGWAPGPARSA